MGIRYAYIGIGKKKWSAISTVVFKMDSKSYWGKGCTRTAYAVCLSNIIGMLTPLAAAT